MVTKPLPVGALPMLWPLSSLLPHVLTVPAASSAAKAQVVDAIETKPLRVGAPLPHGALLVRPATLEFARDFGWPAGTRATVSGCTVRWADRRAEPLPEQPIATVRALPTRTLLTTPPFPVPRAPHRTVAARANCGGWGGKGVHARLAVRALRRVTPLRAQDRFVAELEECCWLDIVLHPLAASDVRPRARHLLAGLAPCLASAPAP